MKEVHRPSPVDVASLESASSDSFDKVLRGYSSKIRDVCHLVDWLRLSGLCLIVAVVAFACLSVIYLNLQSPFF